VVGGRSLGSLHRLNCRSVCYSIDPWERRWSKKLNSRMYGFTQPSLSLCSRIDSGYASLNRDSKLLLVSNLKDGVDEYRFPSMEKVQTFTHPIDTNCILQTRALSSWNLIVAGGDDGFARVFNRISGQLVSEIRHGGRFISFNRPTGVPITSASSWSAHTSCRGRARSYGVTIYVRLTFAM